MNNKVHSTMKISSFIANYGRELRIGADIRKKKSEESNKICRKNEKSKRESRSGIKKSIERNREVSE